MKRVPRELKLYLPIRYERRPTRRARRLKGEWERYETARRAAVDVVSPLGIPSYGRLPHSLWITLEVHWYEKRVRAVWPIAEWISWLFDGVLWERQTAQCVSASVRMRPIPYQMAEGIVVVVKREDMP